MERRLVWAEKVDLVTISEGIQKVYDVSEKELKQIMKKHNNKVNGSNGSYTIYDKAQAKLYLYCYIREDLKTVRIDIRPKVVAFSGLKRISPKFKSNLKDALPKRIQLERDKDGHWKIADAEVLLKAVQKAITMK